MLYANIFKNGNELFVYQLCESPKAVSFQIQVQSTKNPKGEKVNVIVFVNNINILLKYYINNM